MISTLFDQRDKVVLIADGSSAIGEAASLGFAEHNAHVVIGGWYAASFTAAMRSYITKIFQ
tara:strand:- start:340 stop:522 length:183 start_codon:yes stop_codon:yes gene_type:complete